MIDSDGQVPPETQPSTMAVPEVMSLITLFTNLLQAMEHRILSRMDESSLAAAARWKLHDEELERNRIAITARFERNEKAMRELEEALENLLQREHDEDLVVEARVRPVKTVFGWLWAHWRDLVLLFIGLVAAATFLLDWLTHLVDGSPT